MGFYEQVPGGLEIAEAVKRNPILKGEVAQTLSFMQRVKCAEKYEHVWVKRQWSMAISTT
jgi:hypothetical protein